MKRQKVHLPYLIFKLVIMLLFVALSGVIIAATNGYLYDWRRGSFVETGIINLTVRDLPVTVSVNGKDKIYKRSPINLSYLVPGRYTVKITKEGYFPWEKAFTVSPGNVRINPFIELFLEDVQPEVAVADRVTLLKDTMVVPSDLDVRANEVWIKKIERTYPFIATADDFSFVARYSSPILGVAWTPNKTNMVFQVNDEIRIIDRDGTNDNSLVKLSSDAPTVFAITNDGDYLIYRSGDQVYQRKIQ